MAWPKGRKRPGHPPPRGRGRQKGTPNKATINLREAIVESLEVVGGVKYLVKMATTAPTAYAGLLGRIIPQQHTIDIPLPTDEQLAVMTPLDMLKWTMRATMQAALHDPT